MARLAPVLRRSLKEARTLAALKEAQAENLRTAGLLRTVLESTTEGILVADVAGRIATYNRKFMALCGIPDYVMAPMDLERVLRFLQDQFADPGAFLDEALALADHSKRRLLGALAGRDQRSIAVFGRSLRMGRGVEGRVFSFMEASGRFQAEGAPEAWPAPPDLLEAARAGRTVPWYLTEDDLVLSDKARVLLDLAPGGLPRDLPGLEALIHPGDLDRLREALEHPGHAPFELRMRKGDGSWIRTRWNLKRGPEGYRGMFTETPGKAAAAPDPGRATPRFDFRVSVLQES
jgi:PAS domain-containing protein